jgi:hypothetical protein
LFIRCWLPRPKTLLRKVLTIADLRQIDKDGLLHRTRASFELLDLTESLPEVRSTAAFKVALGAPNRHFVTLTSCCVTRKCEFNDNLAPGACLKARAAAKLTVRNRDAERGAGSLRAAGI